MVEHRRMITIVALVLVVLFAVVQIPRNSHELLTSMGGHLEYQDSSKGLKSSSVDSNANVFGSNLFCSQLQATRSNGDDNHAYEPPTAGAGAAAASWWWTRNFEKILDASLFPTEINKDDDANYEYLYDQSSRASNKDFYRKMLLRVGAAFQLEEALMTPPNNEDFQRIYGILERRWLWFSSRNNKINNDDIENQQPTQPPPPLKILVMGGSATVGSDCNQPVTIRRRKKQTNSTADDSIDSHNEWEDYVHVITRIECSWSSRLESFVNLLLGYDAIRVVNVAQGGTRSDHGKILLKYQLTFPDDWNAQRRSIHATNFV